MPCFRLCVLWAHLAFVAASSVLNVPKTASQNDIRERHRALSVIFHPDKQHDESKRDTASQNFLAIQKAYEGVSGRVSLVSTQSKYGSCSSVRSISAVRLITYPNHIISQAFFHRVVYDNLGKSQRPMKSPPLDACYRRRWSQGQLASRTSV